MASVAEQSALASTIKSWPERIKTFYSDVRTEMKKVTSPSFKEVQATTVVVIIAVAIFGLYFFAIDSILSNTLQKLYTYFISH